MLAQDLYRRAIATLAEVDRVHVALRSVNYPVQDRCPQCALTRQYVRYDAPDRIWATWFHCNPVAERQRSDLVQVGSQAYERRPLVAGGAWAETKPFLETRDDLPMVIARWLPLPSADSSLDVSRFITAFHIPAATTIVMQGREQRAFLLPVEIQRHPRIYFPGVPIHGGPVLTIPYRGSLHRPDRILESARLFVDAVTAHPLRCLSTVVATIDGTTTVVVHRTHMRFRYDAVAPISLPVTAE